jgi:putative membrane protein
MIKYALLLAAPLAIAIPAAAQVTSPAEYVKAAGASDLYERTSSQIVLQTTSDPKIRSFATMMLRDHAQSTQMVEAAAAKSGLQPAPPMLTPEKAQLIAQLQDQTGRARDATYLTQQRAAHRQALALHQAYTSSGTAPALKMAASKIVPVVQEHIAMLSKM